MWTKLLASYYIYLRFSGRGRTVAVRAINAELRLRDETQGTRIRLRTHGQVTVAPVEGRNSQTAKVSSFVTLVRTEEHMCSQRGSSRSQQKSLPPQAAQLLSPHFLCDDPAPQAIFRAPLLFSPLELRITNEAMIPNLAVHRLRALSQNKRSANGRPAVC